MRQIRDMSIIEIDITNVCEKRCSNCTRFCGHHKKKLFLWIWKLLRGQWILYKVIAD